MARRPARPAAMTDRPTAACSAADAPAAPVVAAASTPVQAFSSLRMARKLRLNQLLIVDSILQTHSFAATAQNLGLTQSAITKAVQDLETFFDARLFERTNRGVRPTELGLRMGEHARAMLTELRYMTDSLNDLRMGEAGHVVIGTLTTASSRLLPDAIHALRARHPKMNVSIVVGDRNQLHANLIDGKIDIVMGAVPPMQTPPDELVRYHVLYEDELYIVAGSHHRLAAGRGLRLAELLFYPWIIMPHSSLARAKIDRLFAGAGLGMPADTIESLSPITNMGLLMDQQSLSFMSAGLAQLFLSARLLVRLDVVEHSSFGDVGYAIRAGRTPSIATQTLIGCLQEQVLRTID